MTGRPPERGAAAGARLTGGLSAERIHGVEGLERARRRAALPAPLRPLTRAPALAGLAGLAGAALLALVGARAGADEALGWWLVATALGAAGVTVRAPWRFYWREGVVLLGRLPVRGDVLHAVGARRGTAEAAAVALALGVAALPALGWGDPARVARLVGLGVGACALAAALAPLTAVLAGGLVASERAGRALASAAGTGEVPAPTFVWLSVLPAMGAAAAAALVFLLAPWAARGAASTSAGPAWAVAGAALALGGAGLAASRALASRLLAPATRAVLALEVNRLAHVDLVDASSVERAWGRLAVPPAGRAIYRKDVALARRRHPAHYLVVGLLVGALALLAAFAGDARRDRALPPLAAGIAVYGIVLARRLARPPVEEPRLLRTLPLPGGAVARAKGAYAAWRIAWPILLGASPALVRSERPGLALAVAAMTAAAVAVGIAVAAPRGHGARR